MAQSGSCRPPHPRKAFCTSTTASLNQRTTQALLNVTQTCGSWDTLGPNPAVSQARATVCRLPGTPGSSLLHSGAAQLLAGMPG